MQECKHSVLKCFEVGGGVMQKGGEGGIRQRNKRAGGLVTVCFAVHFLTFVPRLWKKKKKKQEKKKKKKKGTVFVTQHTLCTESLMPLITEASRCVDCRCRCCTLTVWPTYHGHDAKSCGPDSCGAGGMPAAQCVCPGSLLYCWV